MKNLGVRTIDSFTAKGFAVVPLAVWERAYSEARIAEPEPDAYALAVRNALAACFGGDAADAMASVHESGLYFKEFPGIQRRTKSRVLFTWLAGYDV